MIFRPIALAALLLGLVVGPGAAGQAWAGEPATLTTVTLQLKWQHQFQFAGYYAAIAQGYYREAGLDVRLLEAEAERDPVQAVLDGRAEFGVGNSDLLLLRASGRPVVVLAAIFQHSPLILVTRAASGVSDLQGLHDRQMMIIDSEKAELFAYFKYEGVDINRLRVRPHTLHVEDFIAGRVDAMSAYSTDEPFELRKAGIGFHAFTARSGGIDFYGDNLFTTEDQIRRNPERVRAFREASLRGWEYALANPAEIVDLIRREYPHRLDREHLEFEAAKTAELMHPGIIEVGHMNPGRWRHIADTYAEFRMLPRGFDLAGFLYDPNPQPDLRWVYWSLGTLAVIALAAIGWVLPLLRLNRQLRTANEAKSRYLAFLSHEIRTPLHGIVGVMDEIKSEDLHPEPRRHIELAEQATQNLLQLVDNVLDHSRIESKSLVVESTPVVVGDLVTGLVDLYRVAAEARGLSLSHTIHPGIPEAIVTDPLRLRQILANLVSNALKFTSAGTIEIEVSAEPPPHGAGRPSSHRVRFCVRDTGPGIAADKIGRIFEPFAQADPSVARRFGGSGLGLAISQRLAELLGGRITVISSPGSGSTFTLEITAEGIEEEGKGS